jgi:hypothetical protein
MGTTKRVEVGHRVPTKACQGYRIRPSTPSKPRVRKYQTIRGPPIGDKGLSMKEALDGRGSQLSSVNDTQ